MNDADEPGDDSPVVTYNYTDPSTGVSRLTQVDYPGGRSVYYNYGSADGIDDRLNRVANIADDAAGTNKYAQYAYLGAGTVVKVAHPAVGGNGLTLTYDPDENQSYDGFDRFGRVVEQTWQDTQATPDVLDEYTYGYDRNSNRLYRENTQTSDRDELYDYDGLNRLTTYHRGDLDGDMDEIPTADRTRGSTWTLSQTGNWSDYRLDANGDGDYSDTGTEEVDQDRAHNDANEIDHATYGSAITELANQPAWVDPVHDAAGNMTVAPMPGAEEDELLLTYDAWNRLMRVDPDDTDLEGHWKLDGDATDETANGNDGTLQGDAAYAHGREGRGVELDGDGDYVNVGDDDDLDITGDLTLAAWVRVDGSDDLTRGIIGKNIGTSDCAYFLGVNESTGEVQFWVSPNADGSGLAAVTADAPRGVWVHLTAVYDTSASLTLYVNGVQAGQNTTSIPASINNSAADLTIGRGFDGSSTDLEGAIDDVRIYSRALSAEEVAVLAGGNSAYDGLNRRIVHAERDFYYNTSWQTLEVRTNGVANPLKQYVWDLRYIDAPVLRWRDEDTDDTVDDTLYYLNDANMNVTAVVDGTDGDVVERYAYDPYGRVTVLNGENGADADVNGTTVFEWDPDSTGDGDGESDWDNRILYCGYRLDPETGTDGQGIMHVRWRMYHPTLGRWTSRDPKDQDAAGGGYHDGMSAYAYCGSLPVGHVDPTGEVIATFECCSHPEREILKSVSLDVALGLRKLRDWFKTKDTNYVRQNEIHGAMVAQAELIAYTNYHRETLSRLNDMIDMHAEGVHVKWPFFNLAGELNA